MRLAFCTPSRTRSSFFAPAFWPAQVAMVPPRASKGVQKNMLILLPVDTAATAMEPRELTAACKITLPMAVMEYWSPIGIPILQRVPSILPSGFHSPFFI